MMKDLFFIRKFGGDTYLIFRIKECIGPDVTQYKLSIAQGETLKENEADIYLGNYLTLEEAKNKAQDYQLEQ